MKRIALLLAVAIVVWAAPVVPRSSLATLENTFVAKLQSSRMEILNLPRGVYLEGYGAVFMADVNLTYTPAINPFHLTISKEDVVKFNRIKLSQMPVLRADMLDILVNAGSVLDKVPPREQIVLVVTLGNETWENTAGLPSQVQMQAQRSKLIEAKAGKVEAKTIVKVQEL